MDILFLTLALLAALLLTEVVRRLALATDLVDRPNQRSSHVVPTPRGGGLAIVLVFLASVAIGMVSARIRSPLAALLILVGGAVAIVGLLDDRRHVPARWRFLVHTFAAIATLWSLGGAPAVTFFGRVVDSGVPGAALAAVFIVWCINLCNFMDGIDGIAGVEAICVALGGAACWWLATGSPLWFVCALFAASAAGFLVLNFPPARIFMGDVGSGFVGTVLAVLSVWSAAEAPRLLWCWLILLGCFMVDATVTLLRRVWRGERFYEAHRSHAYQQASRVHRSHRTVTLAFGAINVLWLLPWAVAVAVDRVDGVAATLVAYVPLIWLAYRYKAGDRAAQATQSVNAALK